MLFSTVLNLFFIPTLYVILSTLLSGMSGKKATKLEHAESVR